MFTRSDKIRRHGIKTHIIENYSEVRVIRGTEGSNKKYILTLLMLGTLTYCAKYELQKYTYLNFILYEIIPYFYNK